MKTTIVYAASAVLGLLLCHQATGQVSVIRQLPQSGAKQGTANWSKPYPESGTVAGGGEAEMSGRISVGGRGGQDASGEALYDAVTESRIALVQPLGPTAALAFGADAVRNRLATEENQDYSGTLSLDLERLQMGVAGGYSQSRGPIESVEKEETDAFIEATLSVAFLETLPMSLGYTSTWLERRDDAVQTDSSRSDALIFKAAGTMGRVGVELGSALDYTDDLEARSEVLGTNADLRLSVPILESVAVQVTAAPNFSRNETDTTEVRNTNVESGIGVLYAVDDLVARLSGFRIDSWTEGSGETLDGHNATWKAEIEPAYQPGVGLFVSPMYGIAKTVDGNLSHSLKLPLGWRGDGGIITELSTGGSADLTRADSGTRIKDTVDWNVAFSFLPLTSMMVNGNYLGGYTWEAGSDSWDHQAQISYSHSLDSLLDYRASASLSHSQANESNGLWTNQYQAGVTLRPKSNLKVYTVDLSEIVDATHGASGDHFLSTSAATFLIPLTAAINTRWGTQWERINRTAPGEGPGNNYRHTAALSLSGDQVLLSADAEYTFSHGYRGVRHDINSGLQVPIGGDFALEGVFTLSSYTQDGQYNLPFLFGLNLVYEF